MLCSPRVDPCLTPAKREHLGNAARSVISCRVGRLQVFSFLILLALPMTKADGQSREEAVRAAREGRTDEAIRDLQSIVASNSRNTAAALDLATILTWAKRPRDATDVFERAAVVEPPEYVLLAMTRAYRDQQRFALAQQLAQEGLRRFPQQNSWPLLNALLAGDLALASGDHFAALRAYASARELAPEDVGIAATVSGVLMRLNAPYGAASLLSAPDLGIQAAEAAAMVRWGIEFVPPEPAKPPWRYAPAGPNRR